MKTNLIIPKDVGGQLDDSEEDDYGVDPGNEEEGEEEQDDNGVLNDEQDEADDKIENEIFALARENKEINTFANTEMVGKIKKIEEEMMDEKKWQLKGEI